MAAKPKIAVLGAGMGGLAMAALLDRAGCAVTVYEQAKAFARVGAGIQMSPNALRVLRALDLEAQHAALLSSVPAERIALNKKLTDLSQNKTSVTLTFADGGSASADIVIATDGLHSRAREILFGAGKPRFTGNVAYRAVFPTARLGGLTLDDNCKWWGPNRHIVIYYLNPRQDELYFVTSVPDPDWKLDSWSAMGDLDELRAAFDSFHPDVRRVLAACPAVHIWAIADRDPMPRWSAGRI
ncbi:MAG: NAD(P)-binding protein, partial [Pseudolabrys sp.]